MSGEIVFQTEWFSIVKKPIVKKPGVSKTDSTDEPFYIMEVPQSAGVLATTKKGEIILVKQFRPAIDDYTLEFPSGAIEPSELPEQAAERELFEETGYRCDQLRLLSEGLTMTNRTDARYFTYLGLDAVLDPQFKPESGVEVVLMPPEELRLLGESGQFRQHSVLGQLVLADWKFGTNLTGL